MAFLEVDFTGVPQGKLDKLTDSLGLDTEDKVKTYLMDHLKSEVKAKIIYQAKQQAQIDNADFTL